MVRILLLLFCAVTWGAVVWGQDARTVLDEQAAAWNRGDLKTFVETYENSPQTTFMGKELTRGRDGVLTRYEKTYDTPEKRGKLRFEVVEVRPLGGEHALLIGKYFLTRTAAGGGDANGQFTLILRKTAAGWKVIHDRTS